MCTHIACHDGLWSEFPVLPQSVLVSSWTLGTQSLKVLCPMHKVPSWRKLSFLTQQWGNLHNYSCEKKALVPHLSCLHVCHHIFNVAAFLLLSFLTRAHILLVVNLQTNPISSSALSGQEHRRWSLTSTILLWKLWDCFAPLIGGYPLPFAGFVN